MEEFPPAITFDSNIIIYSVDRDSNSRKLLDILFKSELKKYTYLLFSVELELKLIFNTLDKVIDKLYKYPWRSNQSILTAASSFFKSNKLTKPEQKRLFYVFELMGRKNLKSHDIPNEIANINSSLRLIQTKWFSWIFKNKIEKKDISKIFDKKREKIMNNIKTSLQGKFDLSQGDSTHIAIFAAFLSEKEFVGLFITDDKLKEKQIKSIKDIEETIRRLAVNDIYILDSEDFYKLIS